MKKRILSILLTLVMVIGMMPATATTAYAAASDYIKSMTINSTTYYAEDLDENINTTAHTWNWETYIRALNLRNYNGTAIRFYPDDELTSSYILPIYVSGDCTINGDLIVDSRISTQLEALAESKLQIYMEHGASLTITGKIYAHAVAIYGPNTAGAKATVTVNGGIQCHFDNHRAGGYDKTLITGDVKALIGNGSNEYGISNRSVEVESPAYALIKGSTYALKNSEIVDAAEEDYTVTRTTTRVEVTPKVSTKDLTKIAVTTNPTKQEYFIGDDFDPAGMVVTAYYDDGSSKVLSSSAYTLQKHIDMPKGEGIGFLHGVRIVYEEDGIMKDTWVHVKIEKSAGQLTSIKITTQPTKTMYIVGDDLDPAGMVVTAYYANGTSSPVTNYTLQNHENMPKGGTNDIHQVLVQYKENGVTQNAFLQVRVKESWPLESIAITKAPNKTAYTSGESFDSAGMEVTAYYEDGSSKVLDSDDYIISVADPLVSGVTAASVSYTENGVGKTAKQAITVTAAGGSVTPPETSDKVLTGIKVTKNPDRMYYAEGEDFDPAGMVVTATYEDGTTADVTAKVTFQYHEDMPLGGMNNNHQVLVQYTENGTTQSKWLLVKVREYAGYLTEIKITKAPNKTTYEEGESFDPVGMEVTAYYDDGTSKVLADNAYEVDVVDPLTVYTDTAYVEYSENGKHANVSQTITVTKDGVPVIKNIYSVAISGITEPVKGAAPVFAATVPADAGYVIRDRDDSGYTDGVMWEGYYENSNGEITNKYTMDADDTFLSGYTYVATVLVEPKDGYEFYYAEGSLDPTKPDVTATMNGETATFNKDSTWLIVQRAFYVPMDVINHGFTQLPAGGEVYPGEELTVTWATDFTPTKIEIHTVVSASSYNLVKTLDGTATSTSLPANKFPYIVVAYYGTGANEFKVTSPFTITEKELVEITAVEVNIAAPVAGNKPSYTASVPADAGYTVKARYDGGYTRGVMWETNGEWMHGETKFIEGQEYVFTVLIQPKEGYEFYYAEGSTSTEPDVTVTVNGEPAIFNKDSNWLIVQYRFTVKGITLTGSATDGIKVKVENLKNSATLMVAQYEGGRMVDVQTMTVTADGTYTMDQLTHKTGCTYKAFLVNSTSYAPLCAADDF